MLGLAGVVGKKSAPGVPVLAQIHYADLAGSLYLKCSDKCWSLTDIEVAVRGVVLQVPWNIHADLESLLL